MERKRREARPWVLGGGFPAIENHQRIVAVNLPALKRFLQQVKKEIGLGKDCVAIRLIGDPEMARLNETYRKKKGPTDVLSFPVAAESSNPGTPMQQIRTTRARFLRHI